MITVIMNWEETNADKTGLALSLLVLSLCCTLAPFAANVSSTAVLWGIFL